MTKDNRTLRIAIPVNKQEKRKIEKFCQARGIKPSTYMRMMILKEIDEVTK